MKPFKTLFVAFIVLLVPAVMFAADPSPVPSPAPAVRIQFALPLADGSAGSAVLLPGANGQTLLVYVANGKLVTGTLVLDGAIVPPVPPLPPVPPPPPPPVEKIWGLVYLHESSLDSVEQGQIIGSKSIKEYAAEKKWNIGDYDKDVVDEKDAKIDILKAYLARAKTLPYFFVVDVKGGIIMEGTLPSEQNLLGILQKIGGDSK
jgi:hypothetical protein